MVASNDLRDALSVIFGLSVTQVTRPGYPYSAATQFRGVTSRDINLYTISLDDMLKSSIIYLLSNASKTKSWLWNQWLSHLNFDTLNQLAKQGLVRGLPKLKFKKDHLCLAFSLGKSKKHSHKPKADDTNQEKLYFSQMDLCEPMCVESINGKKYSLADPTSSPVSTSIEQDAPYASTSSNQEQEQSLVISKSVEEQLPTTQFNDDPFHEIFHEDSTSQESSSIVQLSRTPFELLGKWTKNHPLANMIGNPSRPVSTRKQLQTDAIWCYFDAFLTSVEPNNFKQCSIPHGLKLCRKKFMNSND
ncbi:retrovirus-related pol polyprotein from transposon TNT 1-94 [Tanacetum coccineum]